MAHWLTTRHAALALLIILLAGLLPAATPAIGVAADGGAGEAVREERAVVVAGPAGVTRVQPLVTVQVAGGREALAERLVVGFRPSVNAAERAAAHRLAAAGGSVPRVLAPIGPTAELVRLTGTLSIDEAVRRYQADPRVAYAEPDFVVRATLTPNDPFFSSQWGATAIQAPRAWNITTGAPNRLIAVLDCGINEAGASVPTGRPGHPDLEGKVVSRLDFSGSPYGADDRCNHGTHVAGIAAAVTNNNLGVAGIGFQSHLLNGKVLDDQGIGSVAWVALGIRWAVDQGAAVINLSLSGPGACPRSIQDAVTYAVNRQAVVVVAAGNDGLGSLHSPADCQDVLGVAATDRNDQRAYFSNYGANWVDLAAPGVAIVSTVTGGGYASFAGTSMAAPHVAGVAALVWSTGAFTSARAVADRITATADPVNGTGSFWSAGRVNAYRAVAGLAPPVRVDGGHVVVGATAPARRWYFAEGYTAPGFDQYLTILNPNATTADVTITFFLGDGSTKIVTRSVTTGTRATIAVHDDLQGVGRAGAVSALFETSHLDGIVVERPIYFLYGGQLGGGDNVLGATQLASTWYFAEGYTGTGFDEYLTINNPGPTDGAATINYFVEGQAQPVPRTVTLPKNSRTTITVHADQSATNPGGLGRLTVGHATTLTSTVPVVVERPIYFTYRGADFSAAGGHTVVGATQPESTWYLAEGFTGTGFDQYLTILNPGASSATVTVTYFLGNGTTKDYVLPVAAMARATVAVHDPVQGVGRGHAVAARVAAANGAGIVVERPIYFRYTGSIGTITGGHTVLGATAPSQTWYFAEGYTGTGFDEYLTFNNPGTVAGAATITYFVEGQAQPEARIVALPAGSRTTVTVHGDQSATNPGGLGRRTNGHATRVVTTVPVIVERPIYFTYTLLGA